jgi:hypothetical protein
MNFDKKIIFNNQSFIITLSYMCEIYENKIEIFNIFEDYFFEKLNQE